MRLMSLFTPFLALFHDPRTTPSRPPLTPTSAPQPERARRRSEACDPSCAPSCDPSCDPPGVRPVDHFAPSVATSSMSSGASSKAGAAAGQSSEARQLSRDETDSLVLAALSYTTVEELHGHGDTLDKATMKVQRLACLACTDLLPTHSLSSCQAHRVHATKHQLTRSYCTCRRGSSGASPWT